MHETTLGTITEINIQMNGIVRIETDEKGEKSRTLELTSLAPSGPESNKPVLQPGTYIETYPALWGITKINFIDREKVEFLESGLMPAGTFNYKISDDEYAIILNGVFNATSETKLFFRIVNDSEFNMDFLGGTTSEHSGWTIMTFEKEK